MHCDNILFLPFFRGPQVVLLLLHNILAVQKLFLDVQKNFWTSKKFFEYSLSPIDFVGHRWCFSFSIILVGVDALQSMSHSSCSLSHHLNEHSTEQSSIILERTGQSIPPSWTFAVVQGVQRRRICRGNDQWMLVTTGRNPHRFHPCGCRCPTR